MNVTIQNPCEALAVKTVIQNLHDARAIISAAPVEQINLLNFAVKNHCGTLYCALGWLAVSERFKDSMMLEWGRPEKGTGRMMALLMSASGKSHFGEWVNEMFGPEAFHVLFSVRGGGKYDMELLSKNHDMSDHELVMLRFDRQLEIMKEAA